VIGGEEGGQMARGAAKTIADRVARQLRGYRATAEYIHTTRRIAWLLVRFPTSTKWLVGVKAVGERSMRFAPRERRRLIGYAAERGWTPVVAELADSGITYWYARAGWRAFPPGAAR